MNSYEQKRAARIERLRARANKRRSEASAAHAGAECIASAIPMGQPILIGHHSEKRHRRDLDRIDRGYRKARAAEQEAAELDRRAGAAEDNRAISSDDPEAPNKLKARIVQLEAKREKYKAINRAIKANDPQAALAKLGLSERTAELLLKPDACGDIGIAPYQLSNLGANLRRLKARLGELEKGATEREPLVIGDVRIEESDNRVRIYFPEKPSEEKRKLLKSRGFRWSPSAGAWQRLANPQAWYQAEEIIKNG